MKKKKILILLLSIIVGAAGIVLIVGASNYGWLARDKVQTIARSAAQPLSREAWDVQGDAVLIAQDSGLSLYVNSADASFYVETSGGNHWYQAPEDADSDRIARGVYKAELTAAIIVQYFDLERGSSGKKNSAASVKAQEFTLYRIENGFCCDYYFGDLGITVPLEITLRNGALSARVPMAGVLEEQPELYLLSGIRLLPSFGAASAKDTGYVFVPDGQGALMYFNNNKFRLDDYYALVYGQNDARTRMFESTQAYTANLPVFGIRKNDAAFLAVITQGDASCALNAYTNLRYSSYGGAYAEFIARTQDTYLLDYESESAQRIQLFQENEIEIDCCEICYYFLDGKADYTAMAARYRQYLMEEKGLEANGCDTDLLVEYYCAVEKSVPVMGIPMMRTLPLSTFEAIADNYETLRKQVTGNIALQIQNWSTDQLAERLDTGNAVLRKAGTWQELGNLASTLQNNGDTLALGVNLTRFKADGSGISAFSDAAASLSGSPAYQYQYYKSTHLWNLEANYGYLLQANRLSWVTDNLINALEDKEVCRLALNDIGNNRYGSYGSALLTTEQTMHAMEGALDSLAGRYALSIDAPAAFALGYTLLASNTPLDSSGYLLMDETVPFYQLSVASLTEYATAPLNLMTDPDCSLLLALATNTTPHYILITGDAQLVKDTDLNALYSTDQSVWLPYIVNGMRKTQEAREATADSYLTDFQWVQEDVSKSVFSNGVIVYVNTMQEDTVEDGVLIPAMGYAVREVQEHE